MSGDTKSKISELEKELYSKDFKGYQSEGTALHQKEESVPDWRSSEEEQWEFLQNEAKRHQKMKKFVTISMGFFAIAVAIAAVIWYRGANIISGENISINIDQPIAVAGGDPFETKFTITNNNKVAVETASLHIEYPTGFYSVADSTDLPRVSLDLGSLAPGQSVSQSVNTLMYGEENTKKEVNVTLEYQMTGSNAILSKKTSYSLGISSSPVKMSLSLPKEVSSGQDVNMTLNLESNSQNIINTLVVSAMYPTGFTFKSASIAPTYDTNVWIIPSLVPQGKRTITIHGTIEGQEGDEKAVRISVGTQSSKDERQVGIVYNATTESSIITKPFLALGFTVNGSQADSAVVSLNKTVRVDIPWMNNTASKIMDTSIEVKLNGEALNKYSLYASNGGFYRSVDNTIVWEKSGDPELANVNPGASGVISFSFTPIPLGIDATNLIKNPEIFFEIRAHASQDSSTGTPDLATLMTRTIKFETELRIGAAGWYFSGPFQNSGPIPPEADKETTYTITLTARNSVNNISNISTKTTLPIYVKWLGNVSPDGEDLTYNPATSEVTWNISRLPTGGTREASFQISITPSISQIGRSPLLTGDFSSTATDDFTQTVVQDKRVPVTTYISSDPDFVSTDANVVN